ncbi:hypothetical protein F5Y16DRAFT_195653 [Xylariaceae sp. FL0255]|nr:hypothetical protein F5Y16DRAFT_195653 [Xylariaceae sp. FL0255]
MLLHCNVDRLAALWTAINPNETYQSQTYTSGGLYGTAAGTSISATSPLKPFYQVSQCNSYEEYERLILRKADGVTLHTGKTVASIENFGYTYPELVQSKSREEVIAQITKLYGSGASTDLETDAAWLSDRNWLVTVEADRADLPLPCRIDVYLGGRLAGGTVLLAMPTQGAAHDELPLRRTLNSLSYDIGNATAAEQTLLEDLYVRVVKVCDMIPTPHVVCRCR